MEEGTKVRLVRCPKCQNLLPELPNLPVYQCGGCGAVLQAKIRQSSSDGSSEKSDEEKVRLSSEKVESFPEERGVVDLSDSSEKSDEERDGLVLRRRGRDRDRVLSERSANSSSSSSSRNGNREVLPENIAATTRYDRKVIEQEIGFGSKYRHPSKDPVNNWLVGNEREMNMNQGKSVGVNVEKEIGEFKPQIGIAGSSNNSGKIPDWRPKERDGSNAYRRTPRAVAEGVRLSKSPYPGEGSSNYHPSLSHGYGESIKNLTNPGGPDRVEYLEQDRVELLRKLDELKDQLSRSCDVSDKPKERVPVDGGTTPMDPYVSHDTWFAEASSGTNRASLQPTLVDKHVRIPPYYTRHHEPFPLMSRHDMEMQNCHPPQMHTSNEIPRYGDPFGRQMFSGAPNRQPCQYQQQSSHDYFSGPYMDIDPDYNASYQHNTLFHQRACSCSHCYNKHWQIPPAVTCNRRFMDAPTNPVSYHLGPRVYNPRDANPPPLYAHEPHPNTRRPSDLDSDISGFGPGCPRRVALVKRNGRRCRPFAGGAPFITCHSCFECLPLPRKFLLMEKNQRKMRCGACFTVISCLVENKRLVVCVPMRTKEISSVVNNGYTNRGSTFSDDYDNSGCNIKATETEPVLSSINQRLNLSESEKMHDLRSSFSSTSNDDRSPNSVIARRVVSNSSEIHVKSNATPPIPGSPLREHSEHYSSDQLVSKFGKGNRSKRTNQEELVLTKAATSRQISVKDLSVATEMDVSYNEYSNTMVSQDSVEVTGEEDRPRISKGGDSFFVGLIKKSFGDFTSRSNVLINGRSIPERLIKKAEKRAGPIHPGEYWYDRQAGFWGVMGQPCLGIIPPFIEEFNFPIPKDCSDGNSGVLVNGRELHQNDLDLLSSRGLPTTRHRSYIVDISGRVVDEDSGEELDGLGKLAPTVERAMHGFGMRVPRMAA